jgi:hypothetical protein
MYFFVREFRGADASLDEVLKGTYEKFTRDFVTLMSYACIEQLGRWDKQLLIRYSYDLFYVVCGILVHKLYTKDEFY